MTVSTLLQHATLGKSDHSGTSAPAATTPQFVLYAGGWPARSTVTSSASAVVIWVGPVAPTVGGSGMGTHDVYLRTTS